MSGGRLIAVVGVVVFALFALQRSRSPFLRIESEIDLAASVAATAGLDVLDVMALRELLGVEIARNELIERARRFAGDRESFGSVPLAAVAAVERRDLVEDLLSAAGGDAARAEDMLRRLPEAIFGVRFASVRERFASRRRPDQREDR